MGIDLGTATIQIAADTSLLASGIGGAKTLMLGLAAAAADAAGKALTMAGNFEQQNTMLVTSAGESLNNLQMIKAGVLDVSTATGTSTDQLEAAMYKIESSGERGTAALVDLRAAAEGAKLENSNLADVANAEMTIMTDYASTHITASQAINDLIATVAHGRASIQDMAGAMSTVLPTANAVGVNLYDVSAALSVMTARGTDAASAATYLKQMLIALDAPSSKSVKTLAEIGLTTAQISDEMKISLPGALAMIEDHLKAKFPEGSAAYVEALKNISGGSRTMQGILQLTGGSLKTFEQDAKDVADAVKQGGTQIDGWTLAQKNFNVEMDKARTSLDAFGITMGTALEPAAEKLVAVFQQDVMPRLNDFGGWITSTGLPALDNFGGWFTGTAVPAVEAFANTVERNLLPPVESLIGETIPLVEHFASWLQSSQLLQLAIQDVTSTLGSLVTMVSAFAQGLQDGNPQVALLAGGITAVGTAIGLVKIGEFAAGWYNWFQTMQQGAGFVANVSAKALPELNTALGWTKTGAQDASTAIAALGTQATAAATTAVSTEGEWIDYFGQITGEAGVAGGAVQGLGAKVTAVGVEATAAEGVVTAAGMGMTLALAGATAGISLLVGAVVAAVIEGNGKISQSFKDAENQLGNSAADNAAKAKAAAIESATVAGEQWHSAYAKQIKDSNNARAIAILDQQKIADAAVAAAKAADDAWTKAGQDMNIVSLLSAAGWTPAQIKVYLGGTGIDTTGVGGGNNAAPPTLGYHASGGTIGTGQYGYVAEAGTGGELVYSNPGGGTTVFTGSQSRAMLGGGGSIGPLHIQVVVGSREVASAVVDDVMNLATKKIRVVAGSRR